MVVQEALSNNFSMVSRALMFIIASIVIMLILNPTMTGMTFAGVLPAGLYTIFNMRLMRRVQKTIQAAKGEMNNVAEESFSCIRTVKAFNNEEEEIEKFQKGNATVYRAGRRKQLYTGINAMLNQWLLFGAYAAVVYVSSILYKRGEVTIGEISAFLFYMQMLTFNFMIIGYVLGNLAAVMGASERIVDVMSYEPAVNCVGGERPEGEVKGNLEFRDVKFRYPSKTDVQVLKGVSFSVDTEKNRVVALCGTSGCGKSSIISLIERFYDAEEGEILFNGTPVKDLDPKWYHN